MARHGATLLQIQIQFMSISRRVLRWTELFLFSFNRAAFWNEMVDRLFRSLFSDVVGHVTYIERSDWTMLTMLLFSDLEVFEVTRSRFCHCMFFFVTLTFVQIHIQQHSSTTTVRIPFSSLLIQTITLMIQIVTLVIRILTLVI